MAFLFFRSVSLVAEQIISDQTGKVRPVNKTTCCCERASGGGWVNFSVGCMLYCCMRFLLSVVLGFYADHGELLERRCCFMFCVYDVLMCCITYIVDRSVRRKGSMI